MPEQLLSISGLYGAIIDSTGALLVTGSLSTITSDKQFTVGSVFTTTVDSNFTLIAGADPNRNTIAMTHENSNTLWVGFASPFTFGSGLPIVANQYYGVDDYTGSIWGIGSPTTSIVVTLNQA